jgi:hypothetical protein
MPALPRRFGLPADAACGGNGNAGLPPMRLAANAPCGGALQSGRI